MSTKNLIIMKMKIIKDFYNHLSMILKDNSGFRKREPFKKLKLKIILRQCFELLSFIKTCEMLYLWVTIRFVETHVLSTNSYFPDGCSYATYFVGSCCWHPAQEALYQVPPFDMFQTEKKISRTFHNKYERTAYTLSRNFLYFIMKEVKANISRRSIMM